MSNNSNFVGLFPAAGRATRLGKISSSKEIIRVPDIHGPPGAPAIAVGDYLARQYMLADIQEMIIIRRAEKKDIPEHFTSDLAFSDLTITDIIIAPTPDTSHTLDCAYAITQDRPVALGFPDIIVDPPDVFKQLTQQLITSGSDICVSLFPPGDPFKWDHVEIQDEMVVSITVKPGEKAAAYPVQLSWGSAVWQPAFTRFMHAYLPTCSDNGEVYVGQVLQAAIDAGMNISTVSFPHGTVLDIGTPDDLARARQLSSLHNGQ